MSLKVPVLKLLAHFPVSYRVIKNDAVNEIYIDTAGSQPFIMHL